MLGHLSLRAGRALMLARLAAGRRGAAAIEIEDLVIALIVEDQGSTPEADLELFGRASGVPGDPWPHRPFLSPGVARTLLTRVDALRQRFQAVPPGAEIPISHAVLAILGRAESKWGGPRRGTVEPLHLLEAVVQGESGSTGQALRDAGITPEKVAEAIRSSVTLAHGNEGVRAAGVGARRSWGRGRLVQALAKFRAWIRGWPAVTVEDILVATVIEDQGRGTILERLPEVKQHPELFDRLDASPHTPLLDPQVAMSILDKLEALDSRPGADLAEEAKTLSVGVAVSSDGPTEPLPPYLLVPTSRAARRALTASATTGGTSHKHETEPLRLLAAIAEDEASEAGQVLRDAGITREAVLEFIRRETR